MPTRNAAWFLFLALMRAGALGAFEFEAPADDREDRHPATLVIVFPDSIAGADPRALAFGAAKSGTLFPGGEPSPAEREFVEGLRAFTAGNTVKADEIWTALRAGRLHPLLRSCANVNAGVLLCLRGESAAAESLWTGEWSRRAPAAEGAWRNLLGVFLAWRRFREAAPLLHAVLREHPRNRVATAAQAALLRQLRPDSEWEEFLRTKSSPEDSLPELQLAYGELLVSRGRWAEAGKVLDLALAALPRQGRGWRLLAEAQFRLGYYVFALKCLENALRSGYRESDLYELYASVLRACCLGGDEEQSDQARRAAESLLEEGLPKDLHRRSMAQLLYHVYCQNGKPEAAWRLQESLWFHFEGPRQTAVPLGAWGWSASPSQGLRIRFGLYSFSWVTALRDGDFYRAF